MNNIIIAVDIDGVLCKDLHRDYPNAEPIKESIEIINQLYHKGHYIMILSSRGKIDNTMNIAKRITLEQLDRWGVKYHEINWNQPFFDLGVNDKMFQSTFAMIKAFEKIEECKR